MDDFRLWFTTGLQHILDLNGYDHICYVTVLTILFPPSEWKKILILVTAFTIGHSLTLALSVLDVISPPQKTIECLIPLTIIATCIYAIVSKKNTSGKAGFPYFSALFFGFIHGMAFSYLLKSLLGRKENVVGQLFSFNLGIEAGQLLIVIFVLLISVILQRIANVPLKVYRVLVSSITLIIALLLFVQRLMEI